MFQLGLQIPFFTYPDVPDAQLFQRITDIATTAEHCGFDSVWVMDHFYSLGRTPTNPMLEGYTLLAGLAARTQRVNLGTLVTGVTYRNPALLAKMVTTLDIVSAGRAVLGIGAAWHQQEHAGYGFAFPPVPERMDRLEEALHICRSMFTEESPSVTGRHYHIDQALNYPRPVRPGGPPILIGGTGARRTLRLVAKYADAWNLPTTPSFEQIPDLLTTLERHCEAEDRDPATITKTALRTLVIAPSQSAAERKAAAVRAAMGVDEDTFRCRVLAGGPEAVMDQARSYLDLGLDGIFVNLPDTHDLETVALAGETLSAVVAGS